MTTMNITAIPENPTRDALLAAIDKLNDVSVSTEEQKVDLMAGIIAVMYGPALKELEKH